MSCGLAGATFRQFLKNFFGVFRSFTGFGKWLENLALKEEIEFYTAENTVSKRNVLEKRGFYEKFFDFPSVSLFGLS